MIRLQDGETNMLAGLIRDDERQVLNGIPGLSDIPLIGRLFAHTRTESTQTDIILTLTPHIVRVLDLTEADLRAFRVGRDSARAAGGHPAAGRASASGRAPPAALRRPIQPRTAAGAAGRHSATQRRSATGRRVSRASR